MDGASPAVDEEAPAAAGVHLQPQKREGRGNPQEARSVVPVPAAPRLRGDRLYSPDLNPIEMAFAKLKAHLRAAKARTIEALWKAVGSICELYSPDECWNYLKETRYVAV